MKGARVLIVDDEPGIHRALRPALKACGYQTLEARTGCDALELIKSAAPDIVILDLGLPDVDGQDVLRRVRLLSDVPIVILSAREQEAEKILAFDSGADDYVEKPFAIGELVARLRAALRRASPDQKPTPARIEVGGLIVDTAKHQVTKDGHALKLTPTEYELLLLLARNAGRLLTHREILTAVWGPAHEHDIQYLRVFIGHLRTKIEANPSAPSLILTELGVGYRFAETAN